MSKRAAPHHPVHPLVRDRWSPYVFADRAVPLGDLQALFEAARWAPSSYNEQPWSYVVAIRDDADAFARLLTCLVEANQRWARQAPVLALGIVTTRFRRNARANPAAEHDLGLAAGNLLLEATARGLAVHQMIGIHPERARELYAIPPEAKALTALAIGYAGDPASGPDDLAERDRTPRTRNALAAFVFGDRFGAAHALADESAEPR
jgi:nitroreductase